MGARSSKTKARMAIVRAHALVLQRPLSYNPEQNKKHSYIGPFSLFFPGCMHVITFPPGMDLSSLQIEHGTVVENHPRWNMKSIEMTFWKRRPMTSRTE